MFHTTPVSNYPVAIDVLDEARADAWIDANAATRGADHVRRLSGLFYDAQIGKRLILAAWFEDVFLGHVTLVWRSDYTPFRQKNIPEIIDVWVQPDQRNKGVASRLLEAMEKTVREKNMAAIGLGVGVTEEFGPAHRLYAQRGYVPDGHGLWIDGEPAEMNKSVTLNDSALMMWVKTL